MIDDLDWGTEFLHPPQFIIGLTVDKKKLAQFYFFVLLGFLKMFNFTFFSKPVKFYLDNY